MYAIETTDGRLGQTFPTRRAALRWADDNLFAVWYRIVRA